MKGKLFLCSVFLTLNACFPQGAILQTPAGYPSMNSGPGTTGGQCWPHRVRAQSHEAAPSLDASHKEWVPRAPTVLPVLAGHWGSHKPLLHFSDLPWGLRKLRGTLYLLVSVHREQYSWTAGRRGNTGRCPGGSQAQERLCPTLQGCAYL